MTEPALTCAPHTSLAVAARRMRDADYGTLAVVDSQGRLAGIITDRDICVTLAGTNRNAINVVVREAMTETVFSARLDDDVRDALATMKHRRVRRLPVLDASGRLTGMLSIEDVVVRGMSDRALEAHEIVEALRTMYVRVPVAALAVPDNGHTPG